MAVSKPGFISFYAQTHIYIEKFDMQVKEKQKTSTSSSTNKRKGCISTRIQLFQMLPV